MKNTALPVSNINSEHSNHVLVELSDFGGAEIVHVLARSAKVAERAICFTDRNFFLFFLFFIHLF